MTKSIFHLAIPVHDLAEAERFYGGVMGCRIARRYADRITMDFYGDQVVCHLSPESRPAVPELYPRHFGRTFTEQAAFEALVSRLRAGGVKFLLEPSTRFPGKRERHLTCAVLDPSDNVLEFKYYFEPDCIY